MATRYVTLIEDRVHTTQDVARTAFTARADGVAVLAVAGRQSMGRGRMGHQWWQAPRAILMSLAIVSPPPETVTLVPLLAGLAMRAGLLEEMGEEVDLKWPNDLMQDDAKVGGILVEGDDSTMVIGCGVNIWWPNPPPFVAALTDTDPGPELPIGLAKRWAAGTLQALDGLPASFDADVYAAACTTLGREIVWDPGGSGTAVAVSNDGGLVVKDGTGEVILRSGEVSHVRQATIAADPDGGDGEVAG